MKRSFLYGQVAALLIILGFFTPAVSPEPKRSIEDRIKGMYDSVLFPSSFKKGVALSFYQNGGDKWGKSNWSEFESRKDWLGRSPIDKNQKIGISANFWETAFEDIERIKALGCNAIRFSVEWPSIEPEQGQYNEEALDFYSRYIDALIKAGIEPSITLHHFTHPLWFQELNAFEKEENIIHFVNFSKKVFERFSSRVPMWFTINEPGVQSFTGYIMGIFAPGKVLNFHAAGNVLKNLLNAHVQVYQALKKMDHGEKVQIGLVHQLLKAEPGSWFPTSALFSVFLNVSTANEPIFNFLRTGEFLYEAPGGIKIKYSNPHAPDCYDFIGINYYSRLVIGAFGPTCYSDETMTDMEYAIYPKGIYDAIAEASQLKVPIYITENGIADAKDQHRARFIREYLNGVHAALEDGYDIRGYYYWSLLDNFEWQRGFNRKFGLYTVNHQTQERALREGAKMFRDYFKIEAPTNPNWLQETLNSLVPATRYL